MKYFFLFFYFYCLFFFFGLAQNKKEKKQEVNYNPNHTYSPAQLQADFEMIRFVLENAHPSLDWYISKSKLQRKMDSTALLLNKNMTERAFYQVISPLIAAIHCGHTTLEPSYLYQSKGKRLPLDFIFRNGKAYIANNYTQQQEIRIGVEVLSINARPMFEILQKILPALSSDAINQQGKWASLDDDFANYYDLLIEQPDTFSLTCQDVVTEEMIDYEVPAKDDDFLREYSKNYNEEIQKRKVLDFKILNESKSCMMTINSFLPLDIKNSKQKFKKFLQQSFKTIQEQKIENLIIDLRNNVGGELLYVNELFSYVTDKNYKFVDDILVANDKNITQLQANGFTKNSVHHLKNIQKTDSGTFVKESFYPFLKFQKPKKRNFKGKIYILISKKTFSAASFCASLFYAYQRATLIGEETSGGANGLSGGGFITIELPETNLQLEVPIERWSKHIADYPYKNRGIVPQYFFLPSLEDVFNQKDTTIDFVLALIKNQK